MKVIKFVIVLGFFFLGMNACDKESHGPSRSFYMGFTPFPYAISQQAVDYTYEKIASEADIINHHFDNGVPWVEALQNAPYHINIQNDWSFRKSKTPSGHKVYVSVAALNSDRNGLAKYRSEFDDMALPAPWDTYRFNDAQVKTAYLNYCKRIIDYFDPDFFNMNIEANLLYFINPSLWNDFLDLHVFVYQQLKSTYPQLVIFSSVTGAHMLEGFFDGNDHVQQRLAAMQILEHSDLYALSFYAYLSKYKGDAYPENVFDQLFGLSNKPLAVAETGYVAQTFSIETGNGEVTIAGDEEKQNNYITDLLQACEKRKAKFVINFIVRDYDALWQSIGAKNDLTIAWRDTGLYDENGNVRASLQTWKRYFSYGMKQQ